MTGSIAKNSFYSLQIVLAPNLLALLAIPLLLNQIGVDRFGIFSLALAILGYASVLDFGMSRILSKYAAESTFDSMKQKQDLPQLVGFACSMVTGISLFISAAVGLWFWHSGYALVNASLTTQDELRTSLSLLIFTTPLVALTGTLRGALEGLHDFFSANLVQLLSSTGNFVVPTITCLLVNDLRWAFFALAIYRVAILLLCSRRIRLHFPVMWTLKPAGPILGDSLWITATSFLSPFLLYTDRLFIGAEQSLRTTSYYSTPMDLALRVLVIPQALSRVLLPAFAAVKSSEPQINSALGQAFKMMAFLCFPIFWFLAGFSYPLLQFWLNTDFAENSHSFLILFSLALFWNCLNWITFNFLQAKGHFRFLAIMQFFVGIPYLLLLFFYRHSGLETLALLWSVRLILDSFTFSILTIKKYRTTRSIFINQLLGLLLISVLWLPFIFLKMSLIIGSIYSLTVGALILGSAWVFWLTPFERDKLLNLFRRRKNGAGGEAKSP